MRTSTLVVLAMAALLCVAAPLMGAELIYSFPLDSSPGWTTQGAWAFGAPTGAAAPCGYPDPASPHTGSNVYGYNLSGGYTNSMSVQYLTTTAIDCSSTTDTTLAFWRWLGVENNTWDSASVQVSNNGSDWTTVWANPTCATCDDSWEYCVYDVSAVADGQATVYVRWAMGPTDGLFAFAGWSIDDVQIWSGAPGPYPAYTWNLNASPGWTMDSGWAYGAPAGGGGAYGYPDPTSGHTGSYVYGYNLNGDYTNSMAASYLTTTAIDCSAIEGTTLTFWRWLGVESNYFDHAYVQVSNDGSTWATVWANPTSSMSENYWQLCSYDISAIADGQPTVYIRWQMGPTDSSVTYCGWNIDDIQIWNGPPLPILAWTAYVDTSTEYPNTVQALEDELGGGFLVQETTTTSAATLALQLQDKHVFLVPEPELTDSATLAVVGAAFAATLGSFVGNGGTLVECCEWTGREGFLTATGLMDVTYYSGSTAPGSLPVDAAWHPVAAGLGATVTGPNYTSFYTVGSEALPIITDGAGHPCVAVADYGAGAVAAIGYDYYEYDADAAQILANAVQYPRNARGILLYSDSPFAHRGAEALRKLGYAFTQTDADSFDEALTDGQWDLVVLDNPNYGPYGAGGYYYYDSLLDYLGVWGKSAGNSWRLDASRNPELAAAYDVEVATLLTDPPTAVYQWTSDPFFTTPNVVPDLTGWNDVGYTVDAFELTALSGGTAYAGYTASPTVGKAALVVGNYGTTVMSGFMWDEGDQDADADGVQDVVELVMNQIVHLTKNPCVDMSFSPSETTTGATVDFTGHLSATAYGSTWWFGDGSNDSGTSVSYSYAYPGFYTVSLVSADSPSLLPDHYSIRTAPRQMIVGFPDAAPGYWACNYIIACYEAGIVQGVGGNYIPEDPVSRAAMAVYVARAVAGGDGNVPAGPGTATFPDVGTGYWAFKYVEYAYAQNIVGGVGGIYYPEDPVTRGAMAVYIARSMEAPDGDTYIPDPTPPATFPDVPDTYWAWKWIEYCYNNGIVSGVGGYYLPEDVVTRAAMSVYVQRAFNLWVPYS